MIRQHQFEKVELVHIVRPEDSYAALEELTGHAEAVLKALELPYRVIALCAGTSDSRVPRPTTSRSGCPRSSAIARFPRAATARRSRRGACRRAGAIPRPASRSWCIRSTAQAWRSGRALVAILENCQQADGSVAIPSALGPYMGGTMLLT